MQHIYSVAGFAIREEGLLGKVAVGGDGEKLPSEVSENFTGQGKRTRHRVASARQEAEARGQRTEDGGRRTEGGGTEDGRR